MIYCTSVPFHCLFFSILPVYGFPLSVKINILGKMVGLQYIKPQCNRPRKSSRSVYKNTSLEIIRTSAMLIMAKWGDSPNIKRSCLMWMPSFFMSSTVFSFKCALMHFLFFPFNYFPRVAICKASVCSDFETPGEKKRSHVSALPLSKATLSLLLCLEWHRCGV